MANSSHTPFVAPAKYGSILSVFTVLEIDERPYYKNKNHEGGKS
jgi:hypothetical protein